MKAYFRPESVAILGASEDPTKLGGMLLKNMIDAGYKGKLYPINPKGGIIQGVKAYTSVQEVGAPIELAVLAIKNLQVIEQMKELGAAGVKYVTILSAGFKEVGHEGAELEEKLLAEAKKYGIRIAGPNCFGNMNISHGMNFTFTHVQIGNIVEIILLPSRSYSITNCCDSVTTIVLAVSNHSENKVSPGVNTLFHCPTVTPVSKH